MTAAFQVRPSRFSWLGLWLIGLIGCSSPTGPGQPATGQLNSAGGGSSGPVAGRIHDDRSVQITIESRVISFTAANSNLALGPALQLKLNAAEHPDPLHTGVLLTDVEVNQLLNATQGLLNARSITAPRVTVFNGQRSYVTIAEQRSYLADYVIEVGKAGERQYKPRVEVISDGMVFDTGASASMDRQSVTLSVRDQFSALQGMVEKPFPGAPADQHLMIQQPMIATAKVLADVQVPQRASILFYVGEMPKSWAANLALPSSPTTASISFGPKATTQPSARYYLLVRPQIINPDPDPTKFPSLSNSKPATEPTHP